MNILDQLAEHARQRVEAAKQRLPLAEIKRQALSLPKGDFRFEKALAKPGLAFICECKKASPSKGLIAPEFPYLQIAREYEAAGADAISVLTEPKWFLGSDAYLKEDRFCCLHTLPAQGFYRGCVHDLRSKASGRFDSAAHLRDSERCTAQRVSCHL